MRSDADRRRRRWALLSGLLVAGVYLAGAFVTARIDPLARRPIFDGFSSPPPYRWVSPPPSLAKGNFKAESGRGRVKFGGNGVSQAQVVSTGDLQATLILSKGSFLPMAGQTSVLAQIDPMAPPASSTSLPGLRFAGNVYRVTARYQPDGASVPSLSREAQLTLVAPPSLDGLIHPHRLLYSSDQRVWTVTPSNDAIVEVGANVRSLGYFAVAETVTGGRRPFPLGKVIQYALVGALVLVVVIPILLHEVRTRRSRKAKSARHRGRR